MKRMLSLGMLLLLASGCAPETRTSGDAICDATRADRATHAAALADEGSDRVVLSGQALIARIDAACAG